MFLKYESLIIHRWKYNTEVRDYVNWEILYVGKCADGKVLLKVTLLLVVC
jgi:hypothetical protein